MEQLVVAEEFKLIKMIRKGRHSETYQCVSIKTGKEYATKIQPKQQTSLIRQAKLLLSIQKQSSILVDYGLPICYLYQQGNKRNAIVQDLLGSDLNDLLKKCKGIFRINTFLMLADQMLKRLQMLHRRGYIHRSITLKKWAMGRNQNCKKLYLLGFSRSKHYIKDNIHMPYAENKSILNEIHYASINNHLGVEASRRDDLESMVYCWVKMVNGSLPWETETLTDCILSKKIEQRGQILFQKFPQQLKDIAVYIKGLGYSQTPDYDKIRNWILQLFASYNCENSFSYDWQLIDKKGEYVQFKI